MINSSKVVVVGAGFAGVWAAAAAAALRTDLGVPAHAFPITVVSPGGDLVIRPGLYQSEPWRMRVPVDEVLKAFGVERIAATVTSIDPTAQRIGIAAAAGSGHSLGYEALVLASGSRLARPDGRGAGRVFDVDTIEAATRLDAHLRHLHASPDRRGRHTVVVVGAGFAGLEVATELVSRLRAAATSGRPPRVVLIEAQDVVGPDLGPGPRPVITQALADAGVEVLLGRRVAGVTDDVVVLDEGSAIDCSTVVWTAGMHASALTRQVRGVRDRLGRLTVDEFLRVPESPSVFAAGDTAAARGPDGQAVLQSCQHAIPLGKFAGHNAAAALLGQPLQPFDPGPYVTCVDLGAGGAVLTTGWDREVRLTGESAKAVKKAIVESYIYPPVGDPAAMLAQARVRPNPPLPT
jgi:NADH dehydrogenase